MITIDAQNKKLGRVATAVVKALRGKDAASFTRNVDPQRDVTVINASKMDISEKKKRDTIYHSHSGYMGGVKKRRLGAIIEKRGHAEVLRKAVRGMLPDNTLRARMLKRLTITA